MMIKQTGYCLTEVWWKRW